MHIKIKSILSIILTIILLTIIFTSCDNKVKETIDNNNLEHQKENNQDNLDTNKKDNNETEIEEDKINKIEEDPNYVTLPKFNVEPDKIVTFMSSWTPPTLGESDMDLWPMEDRFLKKMYDVDVEYIKVPQVDIPTKQAAMVMAGNPADVVRLFNYVDYPYSFANGLYEPLNDILPLDSKVFDASRKYLETLKVNGKAYWAPHVVRPSPPSFIYNKSLIEEAGLEDPWELVKENKWDWNTFLDYCKQLTLDKDGDGVTDQYGAGAVRGFINNMVNTIGYPISKIDKNNNVEINLRDKGLMAFYEFLKKIGPFGEAVFHPLSFKEGQSAQKVSEEFLNGNIAFYYGYDDGVALTNKFRPMFEKNELGLAILPKYPGTDKQYIAVQVSGLGISKGAKHPQTAAAYITYYTARYFNSAKEIIDDSDRIVSKTENELGIDLLSLNDGDYKLSKADIYDALYVNKVPTSTLNYIGLNKYIERQYIKDYPERVVFDFGQFACLTDYLAFEKLFSGDESGNPITAQQIIEEIEPKIQEKIDKYQKAINSAE